MLDSSAVVGNGLVITVILKSPTLHKPSYYLICGMAIIDIFGGLMSYFLIIRMNFFKQHSIELICLTKQTWLTLSLFLCGMCLMMSLLISIDRYLAVSLKQRYKTIVTKRRVFITVLIAFASVLTLSSTAINVPLLYPYSQLLSFVTGLLLLLSTFYFYTKSYLTLRRCVTTQQDSNLQNSFNCQKYKRSLNTMVIILLWLLMCYMPLLCAVLRLSHTGTTTFSYFINKLTVILFYVNSCTNPIIYVTRFRDIRQTTINMLFYKSNPAPTRRISPPLVANQPIKQELNQAANKISSLSNNTKT